MRTPPSCQPADVAPVAAHQGFLLRTRPAFHLSFCGNRIRDRFEVLSEDQRDGAPFRCVTAEAPSIVLTNTFLQRLARSPDIVAAVGAAQNIEKRAAQGPPPSFDPGLMVRDASLCGVTCARPATGFATLLTMRPPRGRRRLEGGATVIYSAACGNGRICFTATASAEPVSSASAALRSVASRAAASDVPTRSGTRLISVSKFFRPRSWVSE